MRLFKFFKKYKKNIAIIYEENNKLTYGKLLVEIKKIKKNIKERSLILIISENSIGSLLAYIFCILNNHVVIIVDSKTSQKNIYKIFKNYKPNYIFTSDKKNNILKKNLIKKYNFFNQILYRNKINIKKKLNKELSILLSTSGSMGSTKFVKLSKENIKINTDSIISYLKINKKDSAITNLPISYSYMISIINTHLEVGGSIVISNHSLVQKEYWKYIEKNKITSFNGVPYTYEILSKIGFKNIISQSIRYLTQAGGKIENNKLLEILKFCKKYKLKFYSMYGQTEAAPRISYLNPKYSFKKIGSIGKAIPGIKISLIDNLNNKINDSFKQGEVLCEGKNIFMGYSKNYKDLYESNKINFKLKTGDLGYFDKDDFFYLTGRKNKITKIFGNRIDIEELENLMDKKGFKVVCLSNNKKIFIFKEKKYKKIILLNTISKITNLNIQSFELIKLRSFPRTINGKISYNKLKKKINDRL